VQLHIQFPEPAFLTASVAFAGPKWVERYYQLKARATLRVQPDELGSVPDSIDPYERNNLWQLYTALSHGPERVRFIALWDGQGGEGAGGTQHMVVTVRSYSGLAYVLDTKVLW
jgi:hypothetical protein